MPSNTEGQSLTFKWLTSLLLVLVLSVVSFWARSLTENINALTSSVMIQGNKIADVEGQLKVNGDRLQRIETNQDLVLRRIPR